MLAIHGLLQLFFASVVVLFAEPAPAGPEPTALPVTTPAPVTRPAPSRVEPVRAEPVRVEPIASSPLPAGYPIAGRFGYRPSRRTGRPIFHAGLDFTAERGTPVYAVRGGVVETVAHNAHRSHFAGYGNAVVLHHPDENRWSFYAHLDGVTVQPGQTVEAGTLIGRVGNTTNGRFRGMGNHLHFELRGPAPGGLSPFPGVYRRHNLDPEAWLESHGVRFEHDPSDLVEHPADAPVLVTRVVSREPMTIASR